MKQDNDLAKKMIGFMYGLLDYKLPENAALKAILYYSTEEDRKILEKNGIFCLDKECSQEEILDALNNKSKTATYIGFHADDMKMGVCLEDYNIPSIYTISKINEDVYNFFNLTPSADSPIHFSNEDIVDVQKLMVKYIEKYKTMRMSNKIFIAIIPENQEIDEVFIKSVLETKYNMMNVFQEFNEEMTRIVSNYARS